MTRRWVSLAVATMSIGFLWLAVLPLIGEQPRVAEHIATQQRLRIDPSALFYTELEISPEIARRVERLHETHAAEFWNASQTATTAE